MSRSITCKLQVILYKNVNVCITQKGSLYEKTDKRISEKNEAPVKVLQFGEGNFMRGFIDWQIQQLNNQQLFKGNVAIIQPLEQGLGNMMNQQDNLYTVILQGLSNGEIVDTSEIITVVEQMINPYDEWDAYLSLAENDDLAYIVSNTTEAGINSWRLII